LELADGLRAAEEALAAATSQRKKAVGLAADTEASLAGALAELNQTKAALVQKTLELERLQKLVDESGSDTAALATQLGATQAELAELRSKLVGDAQSWRGVCGARAGCGVAVYRTMT
jgi:ABC-type transporter Mla subunit MlaD